MCQALQEYSKPNQRFICGKKQEDILKSVLKNIDDTYSDNHNVRSRNGEQLFRQLSYNNAVMTVFCGVYTTVVNVDRSIDLAIRPSARRSAGLLAGWLTHRSPSLLMR